MYAIAVVLLILWRMEILVLLLAYDLTARVAASSSRQMMCISAFPAFSADHGPCGLEVATGSPAI